MTKFYIEEKLDAWFEMEGGGRIHLQLLSPDDLKDIKKQSAIKRIEYKEFESGRIERFEVEEVNDDLQNELFWDRIIIGWKNLFDFNEKEIPCTRETKMLLMTRSEKFQKFVVDSVKTLTEESEKRREEAEKNS